jgi:hypothetical protein
MTGTNRSFGNMLNDNIYTRLQKEKESARQLTSERERIRNKFIDQVGRKPSEQEIDALLIKTSLPNQS